VDYITKGEGFCYTLKCHHSTSGEVKREWCNATAAVFGALATKSCKNMPVRFAMYVSPH
jgi:hypothetical protein